MIEVTKKKFIVEFHGKYIPLQGVPHIIRAAKLLESQDEIEFNLVGSGQTYAESRELASSLGVKNINFVERVPYKEVAEYIKNADVCLGIFGDTDKAKRVIPNKIYESLAFEKPVITARTTAIEELFEDGENMLLCNTADPNDLSEKIMILYKNNSLREKISKNAGRIYNKFLKPEIIVEDLLTKI